MKITYLFHSGFVIETESCILVFDCWMDPADRIAPLLEQDKKMYVFCSHFHEDHFSSRIFEWRTRKENITYILSKDILKRKRATKEQADIWLAKGSSWEDEIVKVAATGSTDSGVSWIVEVDGKRIFHAGDLNNWFARFLTDEYDGGEIYSIEMGENVNPEKEEKRYLGELKDIKKLTDRFDIVMFPIDGRIGNGYTRGGRQFIARFKVGLFIPMHFVASGYESAWRMKPFCDEKGVDFWCIAKQGDVRTLD